MYMPIKYFIWYVIVAGWQETFRSAASRLAGDVWVCASRLAADLKVSCQPTGRRPGLEKYCWHTFFSSPSYLPFWSYAPLKNSEWNVMHAISCEPCMLGFWNFIYGFLMEKQLTCIFFLSELSPFLELCPFEKIRMKSCQQDISKDIWAWGLKLGQLIGDDE